MSGGIILPWRAATSSMRSMVRGAGWIRRRRGVLRRSRDRHHEHDLP